MYSIFAIFLSFILLILIFALFTLYGMGVDSFFSSMDEIKWPELNTYLKEKWFIYLLGFIGWYYGIIRWAIVTDSVWKELRKVYGKPFSNEYIVDESNLIISNIRIDNWAHGGTIKSVYEGLIVKLFEKDSIYIPWSAIKSIFIIKEKNGSKIAKINLHSSGNYQMVMNIDWDDCLLDNIPDTLKFLERVRT